jgi:hypothetical protein
LVGASLVCANRTNAGKEIDVPHQFAIHNGGNFIDGNFTSVTVKAHLVGADEEVIIPIGQ